MRRIAVLIFLMLVLSCSSLYAGRGTTNRAKEISVKDVMSHPQANSVFNVFEIIDRDPERRKQLLTRTLFLLADGYTLNNMTHTGLDRTKELGRVTLSESVKEYVTESKFIPYSAGFVTITPIKHDGKTIAFILRRNEGVNGVEWWIGKGTIDVVLDYVPTGSGLDSSGEESSGGGGEGGGCG